MARHTALIKVAVFATLLISVSLVIQYKKARAAVCDMLPKISTDEVGNFAAENKSMNRGAVASNGWENSTSKPSILTSRINRVTSTSRAELLNPQTAVNTRTRNVFHNRMKKTGSRSLLAICRRVFRRNNIHYNSSFTYQDEHPNNDLMLKELGHISGLKPPTLYNRHIHYLDFQHYNLTPPIYINVIRDPINRFKSWFNYAKYGDRMGNRKMTRYANLSDINQCVTKNEPYCRNPHFAFYYTDYFCGFDPVCNGSSPQKRVELAKKHIDENYLVIGITEEFENTIKLLEKMIPEYFRGLWITWKTLGQFFQNETKTKTKDILNAEATAKLRDMLKYDYQVYEHAKAKYEKLKSEYGIS